MGERVQMRATKRVFPDKPADPIVAHPDVRRMLLMLKTLSEGGRLLNYYCAKMVDVAHNAADEAERQAAETELALLTPIAKGFVSEISLEATSNGVQVLGGHGFISEWGLEQEYRDTRITAIYEGTNTIQGLDLLGRKILATGGKVAESFMTKVGAFCAEEHGSDVAPLAASLAENLQLWQGLTEEIGQRAMGGEADAVGATAYDYLMVAGLTTLGYFLAKGASVAAAALA